MKLGIVDMGTNSIHMILVDVRRDLSFEILDRDKDFARLGDQTFLTQNLSPETISRAVATLKRLKKLADLRGVQKVKVVATSAVREAHNGGELVDRIYKQVGYKVRVITGEEEARLIYLAVKNTIPLEDKYHLIVDIGGGSVEIVLADREKIIDCASLKLGTIRLKDQFLKFDTPGKKEIKKMEDYIQAELDPILKKIEKYPVKTMVATSGTLLNLISMAHYLESEQPLPQIHHHQVSAELLKKLISQVFESDAKTRLKLKGMDPARNDLIVPGAYVVSSVLSRLPIENVMACDAAIREGILYDYIFSHKGFIERESQAGDLRLRDVLHLANKCQYDKDHAERVTELALSLFDQTRKWHGLGKDERSLLQYAATLHDIGYHIHFKKHHQHSYYLIKNGEMAGFNAAQIEVMANIARYHSKNMPKKGHDSFGQLSKSDKKTVQVGASLLRIADALDRSHFQLVKGVTLKSRGLKITASLDVKGKCELEIWSADHRKDLFEKIFKKEITFEYSR